MVTEEKIKKCSHCQTDIPLKAKKCPTCHADLRSWFRRHPILTAIGVFILLNFFLSSVRRQIDIPINAPTQVAGEWREVGSWEGTGIKSTEPFMIGGKKWRVVWANEDTSRSDSSILQIFVYGSGKEPFKDFPEDLMANAQGTANDVSYVYKSGEFYLKIMGVNGNWEVSVEEFR